jgi:hypothetical protein
VGELTPIKLVTDEDDIELTPVAAEPLDPF